ncbi:MAG: N-acetylmuramoyl-L-alanine amidase [Eubacteriales bacterium]
MSKIKICLDAGHSGATYNQSTEIPAYYESEMAWKLQNHLKTQLEQRGFEVILARTNQSDNPDVYTCGTKAKGCDCFLSLHSNACGTESVDYSVVYRAYDNLNGANEIALKLAITIGELMGNTQTGRTSTRKTDSGTEYYGVMRGARAVDCPLYLLLEHSFHTNKNASLWLLDDGNLQKLAVLEADILAEYYGISATDTTVDTDNFTPIMGTAKVSSKQMKSYLLSVNASAMEYLELADIFLKEGEVEGVRGDIAFAQALLETGNFKFGGDVSPEQNNFSGLGATGNGVAGNSFDTKELGARAQIQHLKAYACTEDLYQVCVDTRFKYVERGVAPFVEWLGIQENPEGKGWASGADYGTKILTIMEKMSAIEVKEEEEIPEWQKEAVDWAVMGGIMAGDDKGNYLLDKALTRGEFVVMLHGYHKKYQS